MKGRQTIVDRDQVRDEILRLADELFDGKLAPGISTLDRRRAPGVPSARIMLAKLGYHPLNKIGWALLARDLTGLEVASISYVQQLRRDAEKCEESREILRRERWNRQLRTYRPYRREYDPDEYPTGMKACRVTERDGKLVFLLR